MVTKYLPEIEVTWFLVTPGTVTKKQVAKISGSSLVIASGVTREFPEILAAWFLVTQGD